MKILIICDHFPLSPRVIKLKESILKVNPGATVMIVAWNRGLLKNNGSDVITIDNPIGYGNQKKKLLYLTKFFIELNRIKREFKPDILHAIDFEMFFIASKIKSTEKLVYEIFDIKFFGNKILNKLREIIEFALLDKYKPNVIMASPFFEQYYIQNSSFNDLNRITINNKPSRNSLKLTGEFINNCPTINISPEKDVIIGFIGTVRYIDLLKNLLHAVKKIDKIKVLIAGDGPDLQQLKNFVLENNLNEKVEFTGRYTVTEIQMIYDKCDYIWAAYPSKDLNVKYAISNKFFESLVYGKPIIVSKNTLLGDFVRENKIGLALNPYLVDEIVKSMELLCEGINFNNSSSINNHFNGLYWEDEEYLFKNIY